MSLLPESYDEMPYMGKGCEFKGDPEMEVKWQSKVKYMEELYHCIRGVLLFEEVHDYWVGRGMTGG